MPKRKPDPIPAIVDAVNRATDSKPVKGEDLLPPELRQAYLDAKKKAAKKRSPQTSAGRSIAQRSR